MIKEIELSETVIKELLEDLKYKKPIDDRILFAKEIPEHLIKEYLKDADILDKLLLKTIQRERELLRKGKIKGELLFAHNTLLSSARTSSPAYLVIDALYENKPEREIMRLLKLHEQYKNLEAPAPTTDQIDYCISLYRYTSPETKEELEFFTKGMIKSLRPYHFLIREYPNMFISYLAQSSIITKFFIVRQSLAWLNTIPTTQDILPRKLICFAKPINIGYLKAITISVIQEINNKEKELSPPFITLLLFLRDIAGLIWLQDEALEFHKTCYEDIKALKDQIRKIPHSACDAIENIKLFENLPKYIKGELPIPKPRKPELHYQPVPHIVNSFKLLEYADRTCTFFYCLYYLSEIANIKQFKRLYENFKTALLHSFIYYNIYATGREIRHLPDFADYDPTEITPRKLQELKRKAEDDAHMFYTVSIPYLSSVIHFADEINRADIIPEPETYCAYLQGTVQAFTKPLYFSESCSIIFRAFNWRHAYGGRPWARIAETLQLYLTDRITALTFIDANWYLEHNTGIWLNKVSRRYPVEHLRRALDLKRQGNYEQLLTYLPYVSAKYADIIYAYLEKYNIKVPKIKPTTYEAEREREVRRLLERR